MAIIVGDIHGDVEKAQAFLDYKPEELHIALGDYLDSFVEPCKRQLECLEMLMNSTALLLLGNHEVHYLRDPLFQFPGYQVENAHKFRRILEANLSRFQVAYSIDGWLLTHAGLNSCFTERDSNAKALAKMLNSGWELYLKQRKMGLKNSYLYQSIFQFNNCIYVEGNLLPENIKQIFGHMEHVQPIAEPNYIALDTTNHGNSCWIYDTTLNELVQLPLEPKTGNVKFEDGGGSNIQIAWLTDLHLNMVGRTDLDALCESIRTSGADSVLITGDIASSKHFLQYLEYMADVLRMPIYFTLGNHDYYGSAIKEVNDEVAKLVDGHLYLTWLSNQHNPVSLTDNTCLIGHEGLADGRLGDPLGSTVQLNDYFHIRELSNLTKEQRLEVQNHLGNLAAEHLQAQITKAVGIYKHIIVGLHVPPFAAATWHEGKNTDADFLPHFGCQATGEVLKAAMLAHPDVSMTVYCGHTHSPGYAQILPNLRVISAGAEYGKPCIAEIIEI